MTKFEHTNDFIEANQEDESMAEEIKQKIYEDFSSTLVLILDNMGRQKAIAALQIFPEHGKFRKQLETKQFGEQDYVEDPLEAEAAAMQNGDVN